VGARHRPLETAGGSGREGDIEQLIEGGPPIEVEQRIAASPATVFSYLTDPAKFVAWMGAGAELDPRPGGMYRIEVDAANVAIGEYVEVDPPHRLLMTWGWQDSNTVPPGSTTVEITLTPDGADTVLRLRHLGLATDGGRRSHRDGWVHYVGRLASVLNAA
jgi:uncharacterized protein YndB with AHSA1/START domain